MNGRQSMIRREGKGSACEGYFHGLFKEGYGEGAYGEYYYISFGLPSQCPAVQVGRFQMEGGIFTSTI